MSIARSTLGGGPAHATFKTANLHFGADTSVDFVKSFADIETSVFGKIGKHATNAMVKAKGTPLEYANLSVLFPYLAPTIGGRIFGDADSALTWNSNNGDLITVVAAAITKMPPLYLGVDKPMLGEIEFTGLCKTGGNPEDAGSYYTIAEAGTYTPAALLKANIIRQRYSAVWGAVTGFTSFQAQEGWDIDWEVDLQPTPPTGFTRDMKIVSVRAMAKCRPLGPTMTQISNALKMQGTGAAEGHRTNDSAFDLVITGAGVVVTIKNASLETAGFKFAGKELRNGEVGWVSNIDVSTGTATAASIVATS